MVLTGATMPAALVEVGFLSNADEAARLLARRHPGSRSPPRSADAIVEYLHEPTPTPAAPPAGTPTP